MTYELLLQHVATHETASSYVALHFRKVNVGEEASGEKETTKLWQAQSFVRGA